MKKNQTSQLNYWKDKGSFLNEHFWVYPRTVGEAIHGLGLGLGIGLGLCFGLGVGLGLGLDFGLGVVDEANAKNC